jgi:two-component system, cell cycle sensor histidine kinase and response regulator CckA
VKQSGGYVWVYSELGHGTDFKIYLPMVETLAESKARSQRSQEPLARGSETILLVEDDAALREVTCDFLRTSGYIVLTAGSPNKPFASRTLTIVRSTFS